MSRLESPGFSRGEDVNVTKFPELLPLRVLRSRDIAGANVVQVFMVAGLLGMFFVGTLYLQRVLGYDALEIGLAFLPVALAIGALSVGGSARLNARFGPRAVLLVGLALIAAGLMLFTRAPADADYLVHLLPVMLLLGIGGGVAFPALMTLAMSGATESDSGLASGLVNTTQQVGGALGLAAGFAVVALVLAGAVLRRAGLRAAGWEFVVVTKDQLYDDPHAMVQAVGAALRGREGKMYP